MHHQGLTKSTSGDDGSLAWRKLATSHHPSMPSSKLKGWGRLCRLTQAAAPWRPRRDVERSVCEGQIPTGARTCPSSHSMRLSRQSRSGSVLVQPHKALCFFTQKQSSIPSPCDSILACPTPCLHEQRMPPNGLRCQMARSGCNALAFPSDSVAVPNPQT